MATEKAVQLGVEMLRVGLFPGRINTTVHMFRVGNVLIDSGPPNQWHKTKKFIKERGVRRVFLTHHHEDHSGGAARGATDLPDVEFHAPQLTKGFVEDGYEIQMYRRIVWGRPPLYTQKHSFDGWAGKAIEVADDGTKLLPIPVPGHCPDMVAFLEPNRGILFSGDLFITKNPMFARMEENPLEEIESMRRVLKHDFDTMFCSHRGRLDGARKLLSDRLEFLEGIRDRSRELHARGMPVGEISQRLLGKEEWITFISRGHFSKTNMIRHMVASSH
eukprot:Opistho-2@20285